MESYVLFNIVSLIQSKIHVREDFIVVLLIICTGDRHSLLDVANCPYKNLVHTRVKISRTFFPFSVSLWNNLACSVFDGVGLASFKSRANASLLSLAALSLLQSSSLFPFLFFLSIGWYCGAGVFGLIGCISLSPSLALLTFFNNNNYYYYIFITYKIQYSCAVNDLLKLCIPVGIVRSKYIFYEFRLY